MTMTSNTATLPLTWDLAAVLIVLLTIFEAALRASPTHPMTFLQQNGVACIRAKVGVYDDFLIFDFARDRIGARVPGNPLHEELQHYWHYLLHHAHCDDFVLTLLKPFSEMSHSEHLPTHPHLSGRKLTKCNPRAIRRLSTFAEGTPAPHRLVRRRSLAPKQGQPFRIRDYNARR